MSTFNITKNTSSKIKDVSLALILTCSLIGATLSTTVNAAPAKSVENAVSDFVVAQGEKMISELNSQIVQSIDSQINSFSTTFSLDSTATWLVAEQQVTLTEASVNKVSTDSSQVTSN